ncbi:hypothetical protein HanXRQr2_Chr17g0818691 [Helianthus annuus]|uniref:Uncharacterized protein n=1 Tax=Helianthus annuus TaxID=4232 RepID=A0A9K3DLE4_HELAN|nr:hypothetical protein HanXRQr2_Chr17g0818691 [Helianthus annuus]
MNDQVFNTLSKTTISLSLLLLLQAVSGSAAASPPRIISFQKGFTQLFGGDTNLLRSDDDNTVHLHLNQYTGISPPPPFCIHVLKYVGEQRAPHNTLISHIHIQNIMYKCIMWFTELCNIFLLVIK